MASNKILLLLLFITVCIANASQELENMIVKTDVEAVKKNLQTITLNLKTKQRLIDLANDIILMRLKTVEIYSFKLISDAEYENLEKSLSQKTIAALRKQAAKFNKWGIFCKCTCGFAFVSFFTFFGSALLDEKLIPLCLVSLFSSYMAVIAGKYAIAKQDQIAKTYQGIIYSNLQQLYQDSIDIKQLVDKMEIIL